MADSEAQSAAIGSCHACTSSSCRRIRSRRMPRRLWVGTTPTQVTPAQGSSPPGMVRSNLYAPASATGLPPSNAPSARDTGSAWRSRSQSASSTAPLPKAISAAVIVARSSSSRGGRISIVIGPILSDDLLQRSVVEHQLPLAAVAREADGNDAAGLDPRDHALAEGAVTDAVAGRELRMVASRSDLARLRRSAVAAPRGWPQPLALDVPIGQLVEEAGGQVSGRPPPQQARGRVRQRQLLLRPGQADVEEPPLLLHPLLLDRTRAREDLLLDPDDEHRAELEPLRVVDRHQRHVRLLAGERVLVGVERDLLQEAREARLLGLLHVFVGAVDEGLEVLDPPARLDRALRLVGVQRAAPGEHLLQELGHLVLLRRGAKRVQQVLQARDRLDRGR